MSDTKGPNLKLALAQLNTTVGDFAGNESKIAQAYHRGQQAGADLVLVPELALCGYPPRDLVLRPAFLRENRDALERLAQLTQTAGLVVGYIGQHTQASGRPATNAVALLQHGRVVATRDKMLLPTYDVFDEDRYFEAGTQNAPVDFQKHRIGLTVCEDIWNEEGPWSERRYPRNPAADLVAAGAELILNASASPWHLGKNRVRRDMLSGLAARWKRPLAYCNQVGGNDELVFDGTSMVFDAQGQLVAQGRMFEEDFLLVDLNTASPVSLHDPCEEEKLFKALILGLRDYLHKCGFQSAVLGLSGGIDSALTAVIAAAALGPQNVRGVSMPSRYSSQGSLDDARHLALNLGIPYDVVPIEPMFQSAHLQLQPLLAGLPEDATEENMQARLRGVVLMSLSNKFGSLLLTTGNKSELAVGYCTLYGDMCGGLAVISDVPKTLVYRLARWINRENEIIPAASISKPPSAELRPNQTDQDSLPPYETLDTILDDYVVERLSAEEIIARGRPETAVRQIIRLINLNEYKRRQAAPGLKVTSKAFGMGRRIPIAQKFWA